VWNEEHKEPATTTIRFQNYSSKEGTNGETILTNELQKAINAIAKLI